jgi:hypothetical protein
MDQAHTTIGTAKIWAAQFSFTLGIAAALYWWLAWPDERVWQVVFSFVAAFLIVIAWVGLQWLTFSHFRPSTVEAKFWSRAGCALPAFILVLLILAFGLMMGERIYGDAPRLGVRFAQIFTTSPRTVTTLLEWIIRTAEFVWLLLLLPVLSIASADGFGVFRRANINAAVGFLRKPPFWLTTAVAAIAGFYLPWRIANWVPKADSLRSQAISMGLRFALAYALLISGIVILAWISGERDKGDAQSTSAITN